MSLPGLTAPKLKIKNNILTKRTSLLSAKTDRLLTNCPTFSRRRRRRRATLNCGRRPAGRHRRRRRRRRLSVAAAQRRAQRQEGSVEGPVGQTAGDGRGGDARVQTCFFKIPPF